MSHFGQEISHGFRNGRSREFQENFQPLMIADNHKRKKNMLKQKTIDRVGDIPRFLCVSTYQP